MQIACPHDRHRKHPFARRFLWRCRRAARSSGDQPRQPFFDAEKLQRGIGIRFKGVVRTNVEEYCISEGWVRVQAGRSMDRKGRPLTIKLNGPVEAWYEDLGESARGQGLIFGCAPASAGPAAALTPREGGDDFADRVAHPALARVAHVRHAARGGCR
jgi:hypothetical protein